MTSQVLATFCPQASWISAVDWCWIAIPYFLAHNVFEKVQLPFSVLWQFFLNYRRQSKYSSTFFPGFIAHFNEFHEHEFQCQDGSTPKFLGGGFDHVVAVIGDQSSSVTIQVSEMCPAEGHSWVSEMCPTEGHNELVRCALQRDTAELVRCSLQRDTTELVRCVLQRHTTESLSLSLMDKHFTVQLFKNDSKILSYLPYFTSNRFCFLNRAFR
jgi:hypothetical protein